MTQENKPAPDYAAQYLKAQEEAEAARTEIRAGLLKDLRALGATCVAVSYEGYGDSGNVEDITVTPSSLALAPDLDRRVQEFGWDFAYALSSGFENNDGGRGTLTWHLETDKIDVIHHDHYVASETTEHEGL